MRESILGYLQLKLRLLQLSKVMVLFPDLSWMDLVNVCLLQLEMLQIQVKLGPDQDSTRYWTV